MPIDELPPEVCDRIAHFAPTWPSLVALSATSRAFQRASEPRIYQTVHLTSPLPALGAFRTLASTPRVAALVRTFWLSLERAPHQPYPPALPTDWWTALRDALAAVHGVTTLVLVDPRQANSWVLDPARVRLPALRDARLRLGWSAETVAFLAAHPTLRSLSLPVNPQQILQDAQPAALSRDALPALQMFDGPLRVATELVPGPSPLTHLQVLCGAPGLEEPLVRWMPKLGGLSKTLRSLSILGLSHAAAERVMELAVTHCPQLVHLGMISLPVDSRNAFHRRLTRLGSLQQLEVDITYWKPPPNGPYQRALAMELRTFCPTLRNVVFWLEHHRFWWSLEEDVPGEPEIWLDEHLQHRNPLQETFWKMC